MSWKANAKLLQSELLVGLRHWYATTTARDADITAPAAGAEAVIGSGSTMQEYIHNGTSWARPGEYTAYTPNFPNLPISAGSSFARYAIIGRTVHLQAYGAVSGAAGGAIIMDLPVPANVAGMSAGLYDVQNGNVFMISQGVGGAWGFVSLSSGTQVQFVNSSTLAAWGATVPYTWKNTDTVRVNLTYERA